LYFTFLFYIIGLIFLNKGFYVKSFLPLLLKGGIFLMLTNLIMLCIMASAVIIYFLNNPMEHKKSYRMRCFWNWFPLGLTYAFLYMGRYNLTVSQSALSESHLGPLMPKEAFGTIFGTGALIYGFAFLINGDRKSVV